MDHHAALLVDIRSELRDLRAEMMRRFEQVDRRFEQVDQRFVQIDQRFMWLAGLQIGTLVAVVSALVGALLR